MTLIIVAAAWMLGLVVVCAVGRADNGGAFRVEVEMDNLDAELADLIAGRGASPVR